MSSGMPADAVRDTAARLRPVILRPFKNEKTRPGGQPDGSSHMALGVDGRSRQI
jgi:hypothetical protein